jgi:Ca-activated chloride channel family protein
MTSLKDLALRYGILTEYTAYLVQEPGVVAQQRLEDRVLPMAPAPAEQFGAQSVAQAKREAKSAAAANAIDAMDAELAARSDPRALETKRVGGRLFAWRDSAWTDIGYQASLPVVAVASFSDAYFALLAALPELAQPAALEPAVVVAGRRVSVKITTAGRTDWRPGELERLVAEFRS